MHNLRFLLLLALSLMWSCKSTQESTSISTPQPPPPPKVVHAPMPNGLNGALPIPFDPETRTGKLANGLTYYIKHNEKPAKRAELRLVVNAGSIQEDDSQQGLAHFCEHMAFNGTKNFPKSALVDFLESIGMKFGAHLNAYTSFDETVYMLKVPTDTDEFFDKGMQILEDWAHQVSFEDVEIDKERGVVIEEWRTRIGANERMSKKTIPVVFHNSRYAKRLPIGKKKILENFDYEEAKRFYRDWYRPDLMAVVVVGDVDVDAVEKTIKEKFGKIAKRTEMRERVISEIPDHKETLAVVATDDEASYNLVQLGILQPFFVPKNLADFRVSLIQDLASTMLDARLSELSKSESPPFNFAYSGYSGLSRSKDIFSAFAIVPDGGHLRALEILWTENERVREHGFVASELERARKSILSGLDQELAEKGKVDSRMLTFNYVYHFLQSNPVPGIEQEHKLTAEFLPSITVEEVNQQFRDWLTDENRFVIFKGTEKDEFPTPSEASIKEVLDKVKGMKLEAYRDEVVRAPLMSARPESGIITDEQVLEDEGITEITFANGAKIILKPTTLKNDEIMLRAFSPGGSSLVEDAGYFSASSATSIISSSGLGPYDATQLEKYMSDKVVRLWPYISSLEEGFNGSSSVKDAEVMLQMLHLFITAPRFDKKAFASWKSRRKNMLENQLSRPESYFMNEYYKYIYNNNIRKGYMSPNDLDKVDHKKAYEIFQDRLGEISDFTFVFIGSFEVGEFKKLLASYIGSIPSKGRQETFKDLKTNKIEGPHDLNIKRGREPKSMVRLMYSGKQEWNLDSRHKLNTMIGVLKIMLRESMREEKGGVYGVRVSGSLSRWPQGSYNVTISFQCAPENVDELIETAEKDIQTLQREGPSESNLSKTKETQHNDVDEGLESNRYRLSQLKFYYSNELSLKLMQQINERIDKVTADDVKTATGKFMDSQNRIKAVLRPEPKAD